MMNENLFVYPFGRLLCYSKSTYIKRYPTHEVYFNANIFTKSKGKIWFGDIDLTTDKANLQNLANSHGEDVYILRELDGRFGQENYWDATRAVAVIKYL